MNLARFEWMRRRPAGPPTVLVAGRELPVAIRASFGTGLWMHPHDTLEVMLHRADEAMYLDKRRRALTLL